ncbi:MFS multidrug transporter-like protein [Sphaerosporella brunnea]|uniref:MFS multidrug transporter-like protein n=1 Tax=Sphaerosporella brunnea TaxID=1250544 RepID=A0A5J5ED45_9PEZI|nr:MFS multidrug transporter-like protein [Sphaerosporella brunnea]
MRPSTPPSPAGDEKDVAPTPATALSVLSVDAEKEQYLNSGNTTTTQLEDIEAAYANGPPEPTTPTTPTSEVAVPPQDQEGQQGVGRKHKLLIVLSLCMCVFLSALDQTIITTAIPVIAGEFHSPSSYTWIGSSYLLASAAFLPSWGKFSDIWGRKPVLLCAAVLFMIGSVLCAAANGIALLLLGRVIQGLGAGGQLGLVNVTISDIVTVRERGLYLSFIGMTWAAASAIGPVLGGVFTGMAHWGWRFCFIINIPIGLLAITGLYLFLHLKSPTLTLTAGLKRVDWLGTACIVSGVILFLLGLELGGVAHPWNSAIVVCFLVFGILLIISFIIVEWKFAALPLMPLRLFTHRTLVCAYLVGFWHGFVFIAGCYFLPLHFQAARGDSPLLSGVYVLPYVIFLSLVSGAAGYTISRTGRYQEVIWGGVAIQAIGFGLFITFSRTTGWAALVIFQLLAGVGSGPLFQAPLIAVHAVIDPKDVATATATFAFLRSLGTALAISLGLTIFQNAMAAQAGPELVRKLGAGPAALITGEGASASIEYIKTLGMEQRIAAMDAYAKGMKAMWYFFLAIALLAVISSVGIGKHHLSKQLNSNQPAVKRPKRGQQVEAATADEKV